MDASLAQLIVLFFATYVTLGALFALVFVSVGVARLDPAARGAGLRFRFLIFPGCAALWPVVAAKWFKSRGRSQGEGVE